MKKRKGYDAEADMALHLKARGFRFEREFVFCPSRKWRSDFVVRAPLGQDPCEVGEIDGFPTMGGRPMATMILVEIDGGGGQGRHGTSFGMRRDSEKYSAAAALGYRVIRLDERHVRQGRALAWIEAALGLRSDVPSLFALPKKTRKSRVPRSSRKTGKDLPERVRKAAGL